MTPATFQRRCVEMRGRNAQGARSDRAYLLDRIERLRKRLESAENKLGYSRRRLGRAEGMLGFGITAAPSLDRTPVGFIGHVLDALANVPKGSAVQLLMPGGKSWRYTQIGLHEQAKLRGWKIGTRSVGETAFVVRTA